MDKKLIILKYGTNHNENLLEHKITLPLGPRA
jgi:hypothetical protein